MRQMSTQLTGTLKKIKDTGVITIGHRESSCPFSYYDENQGVIGYSNDLQLKVVETLKKELAVPDLRVRYVAVCPKNRFPWLNNSTIDVECGSTTNNMDHQRLADFSVAFFKAQTRLLVRRGSGINDFSDLQDKAVVTTAGTTSERLLKAMNTEKRMNMNILLEHDHGQAYQLLRTDRAVALMLDDILLEGLKASSPRQKDLHIVGTPQSSEMYGFMLRKADAAFKKLVDRAITDAFASGEINKIYAKWFQNSVPPLNCSLDIVMSDQVKQLIYKPTDFPAE